MRILLVAYDPKWPDRYQHAAGRIQEALGARALRIEHVGSTSVPDLPAKPIIDILLVVADSASEMAFRDWLRTNEADRELYARCKRTLAQQEWKYTQNYADAKTPVIEEILSRARGPRRQDA